jgi:transposase-like protein
MNSVGSKRKHSAYDAAFKLKVIELAEANNNCAAARKFVVNEKQVQEWRKSKAALEKMPKSKKVRRTGIASFLELEKELSDFVSERRQNGYIVTQTAIRLRAMQMAKNDKYTLTDSKFVASAGWCSRFMNRNGFCLRQRTKIAQKLPKDLEEKN